jgi:putative transposase
MKPLKLSTKKQPIKKVLKDTTKKSCNYIMTTKYNKLIYGRECGDICDLNNDKCINHLNEPEKKYDLFAINNTCEHIITQKSRGKDRKGLTCGNFTFDTPNPKYCKLHIKQHPEIDNNNENTLLRTFKVRFYPTKEQIIKLNKYFGCSRFTYNKCVHDKITGDYTNIRDKYVTQLVNKYNFLKDTPKEIRAFAITEYLTGYTNSDAQYENKIENEKWKRENIDKYKKKHIKQPEMKYKTKKSAQSITINKNSINIHNKKIIIYPESFSEDPINIKDKSHNRKDKRLNKILNDGYFYHDAKIICTETNKYYICITDNHIKKEIDENLKVVACDTGVRTFITTYDEQCINEIGPNISTYLSKIIKNKDKLKEKYIKSIKNLKNKLITKEEYYKNKNKYKLYTEKNNNRINDLHNKAIVKLMEYSLICIPKLNIKQIIQKNDIPKISKRILLMEKHSEFIKRLENKGELCGKIVKLVDEHLTTKTCSRCFEKYEVKSDKIYKCPSCKLIIDRDINASKNIYIQQTSLLISSIIELLK